jgi:selenocysteine-specific elongation factor
MIIATAGHIDHGKTLLVKALTGIDADRLPEEKKRGMTLDLGFAYTDLANGARLGFIDVPGHERLVHNMLAGVTGIDCALLVVAADDGPMPQTREHLAILDILGVSRGLVALTKIDRVPEDRVHEVEDEIAAMLADSSLASAPIFPVSAVTNTGIDALSAKITALSEDVQNKAEGGHFRLAVDRVFTVAGAGLVVTGTAFSGQVNREDRLWIAGFDTQARVRGIHANNAESETGRAGDRLAINLAGIDKGDIARGDWLVADPGLRLYKKLDVRLRVVADARRPLRHWTPVHMHLGAKNVTGRVAVLGADAIEPGESALAQLVLDEAVGACAHDRFVIRDQSAQITLGGGHVIDLFPPRRGRARADRLAMLDALDTEDHVQALSGALALADTGLNLTAFLATRNLNEAEAATALGAAKAVLAGDGEDRMALSSSAWEARRTEFLGALDSFHSANPDRLGPATAQLRRSVGRFVPETLLNAMVSATVADGTIASDGMLLHRPDHQPGLTGDDAKHWAALLPLLEETPGTPPVVHDLASETGLTVGAVMKTMRQAVRMGMAVQIAGNRFFVPAALRAHGEVFVRMIAADGTVGVSDFRKEAGIGRNLAVEVLEYFDRIKLSQRDGNIRRQVKSLEEIFGTRPVE